MQGPKRGERVGRTEERRDRLLSLSPRRRLHGADCKRLPSLPSFCGTIVNVTTGFIAKEEEGRKKG